MADKIEISEKTRVSKAPSGYVKYPDKEYKDSDLSGYEAIKIAPHLSNREVCTQWDRFVRGLQVRLSIDHMFIIVELGLNLRKPGNNSHHAFQPSTQITGQYTANKPSSSQSRALYHASTSGGKSLITELETRTTSVDDETTKAVAACYLCCSFFKMIQKDVDNFVSSLPDIKTNFIKFYQTRSTTINSFSISRAQLSTIKSLLSSNDLLRNTVIQYLWPSLDDSSQNDEATNGLIMFLAGLHLRHPGMHAYALVLDILYNSITLITPQLLLPWLMRHSKDEDQKAVEMIAHIWTEFEPTESNPMRSCAFRYARHLYPGYFGALQTKRCKGLGYFVATVKFQQVGGRSDPRNIVALKDLDSDVKRWYDGAADWIGDELLKLEIEDPDCNPLFKMAVTKTLSERKAKRHAGETMEEA